MEDPNLHLIASIVTKEAAQMSRYLWCVSSDGVVILGAGLNTDVSNEFHYALGGLPATCVPVSRFEFVNSLSLELGECTM